MADYRKNLMFFFVSFKAPLLFEIFMFTLIIKSKDNFLSKSQSCDSWTSSFRTYTLISCLFPYVFMSGLCQL